MNDSKVRKTYVDVLKFFGIVFVILGHINYANDYVKEWIYSFHMPLFFFATGLTMKLSVLNESYFERKFKSLMIPYFIWGLMYSGYSLKKCALLGYASYSSIISAESLSSLWFLPVIFLATVFAQLIIRLKVLLILFALVLLLLSFKLPILSIGYPWSLDVVILALFFVIIAFFAEKKCEKITNWKVWVILSLVSLVLTFSFLLNPINESQYVLMANRQLGNLFLFFISSIAGCFFCYGMSRVVVWKKILAPITWVGQNTLIIFICHKPVIEFVYHFIPKSFFPWFVELLLVCALVLSFSCLFAHLINRFAPGLAGKIK